MHENIIRLMAVCEALQGLQQDYVFVGEATVSLYATDPDLADEVRPTDDVDVIHLFHSCGLKSGMFFLAIFSFVINIAENTGHQLRRQRSGKTRKCINSN